MTLQSSGNCLFFYLQFNISSTNTSPLIADGKTWYDDITKKGLVIIQGMEEVTVHNKNEAIEIILY